MSIRILAGGSGGSTNSGDTTTSVEEPGGGGDPSATPMHLNLHPSSPITRLQNALARGDGSTTLFTITGGYEPGFLDVFVNGVKQRITTHYTETDSDAGTFTFVQAPKTNDYVDVIWANTDYTGYCGMLVCGPSDITFPNTLARTTTFNPFSPRGAGPRVAITGLNNATDNIFAAYTSDIYQVSPSWTASSTGLPAPGDGSYGVYRIALDPFDSTIAYLVIENFNVGAGSYELWKNTSFFSGGTWAKIYDVSTHNTLTGEAATRIFIGGRYSSSNNSIGDIVTTIAGEGYIGFVAGDAVSPTGNLYWVKSIDRGVNYTSTALHASASESSVVWSQHSASRIYVFLRAGASTGVYKSTDGGTSFTIIAGTDFSSGGSGALYHPFGESSDTADMLIWHDGQAANTPKKSIDSGGTWADFANGTSFETIGLDGPWELTTIGGTGVGYGVASRGSTSKRLSTDGGTTWSTPASTTSNSNHIGLLRPSYIFGGGGTNSAEVYTSPDGATFTTRVGNLHSVAGANPDVNSIVPDWNS